MLNDGNDSEIECFSEEEDNNEHRQTSQVQGYESEHHLDSDTETGEPLLPEKTLVQTKGKKRKRPHRVWIESSFQQLKHDYPDAVPKPVRDLKDYFTDYLDDEFFEQAAFCTNNYHMRKKGSLLKTTSVELKKFVGIHLIMGCIPYPRMHMYWRKGMQLSMIVNHMTRERLKTLRTAFHVIDRDTAPEGNENILWKVQPIIERVKRACDRLERRRGFYSIDEQMIPFSGTCPRGLRQVVKNKPRCQGLKMFVTTTSSGLMIDFEVYQGAKTPFPDKSLGIGAAVILHLTKSIPPDSCIYFDRYFSSIPLLERLTEMGLHGTGTLMLNRLPERNNVPFKKDRNMHRGEAQQFVSGNIVVVKWMDNKSVLMTSNCTSADDTTTTKRWDKTLARYIDVSMPNLIENYNKNMGGVDILDQSMEYYRTFMKTKKWTLKVILHFIDLSVTNAWRLYITEAKKTGVPKNKIKDLLQFRLEIADGLLETPDRKRLVEDSDIENSDPVLHSKRYRPENQPSQSKRYDGYEHFPIFDEIDSPRSCRLENCSSRSKIRCEKCNVYLCLSRKKSCFTYYHKKP